jgi:hypothetical protein
VQIAPNRAVEPAAPNSIILVIGYGSLLSGYGLLAERRGGKSRLVAREAEPITLRNARRGLAKPSSHGNYLAMDLEPRDRTAPITARAGREGEDGAIGALLLTFDRSAAPLIAQREEYAAEHFVRLIAMADSAGQPLGEFLLAIARATSFNLLEYRRALRDMLGYTSPGYVFHPVALDDGRVAIVAIGSGYEGSGDPAVVSRRRECGIDRLHPLPSALQIPNLPIDRAGQIGYFAECLLGGLHGIAIGDLLDEFDPESESARELADCLARAAGRETDRFIEATSLGHHGYRGRFAPDRPDAALGPLLKLARVR